VLANFGADPIRADLDLSGWSEAEVLLDNVRGGSDDPRTGRLAPWQAVVLRRTR
jgi:hypothetical protein